MMPVCDCLSDFNSSHCDERMVVPLYTQATSKCRIQLGLETPLAEALVEDNSYSIVKINNDEHESLRRPETSILK